MLFRIRSSSLAHGLHRLQEGKTLDHTCQTWALEGDSLAWSTPEGPTVQFTGTLMARSRLSLCLTRRPKYSSLHHKPIASLLLTPHTMLSISSAILDVNVLMWEQVGRMQTWL